MNNFSQVSLRFIPYFRDIHINDTPCSRIAKAALLPAYCKHFFLINSLFFHKILLLEGNEKK